MRHDLQRQQEQRDIQPLTLQAWTFTVSAETKTLHYDVAARLSLVTTITTPPHDGCHNNDNDDFNGCIIDKRDIFSKIWLVSTHTYASFKAFDIADFINMDYVHWNVDIAPFSISDFFGADAAFRLSAWQLNACSLHLKFVNLLTISTTTLCSTFTSRGIRILRVHCMTSCIHLFAL